MVQNPWAHRPGVPSHALICIFRRAPFSAAFLDLSPTACTSSSISKMASVLTALTNPQIALRYWFSLTMAASDSKPKLTVTWFLSHAKVRNWMAQSYRHTTVSETQIPFILLLNPVWPPFPRHLLSKVAASSPAIISTIQPTGRRKEEKVRLFIPWKLLRSYPHHSPLHLIVQNIGTSSHLAWRKAGNLSLLPKQSFVRLNIHGVGVGGCITYYEREK